MVLRHALSGRKAKMYGRVSFESYHHTLINGIVVGRLYHRAETWSVDVEEYTKRFEPDRLPASSAQIEERVCAG